MSELHAACFAQDAHKGQVDDDGRDYFTAHVLEVARLVSLVGGSTEMVQAAYLHDTLEDTNTTYDDLVFHFGAEVAGLVHEVTHEGTKDEYGYYFPRLKSRDAVVIKLCDRASNLMRFDSWSDERKAQYLRKTRFWRDGSDRE
jgi:(p)ppGpp synthase/HD superfamily hydrolase